MRQLYYFLLQLFLEQLHAYGQPTHFLPLFLDFIIYKTAKATITATNTITIIFSISFSKTYFKEIFLLFLIIKQITTATITNTAIKPYINPTPKASVVIRVPI